MSYARVNGTDLYFEQHGSGEPVVLLHGGFGAGALFAPLLPQFEGRTVITVDLAGHGHSPDPGRPLRPETLAEDVAALIEHLGLAPVDLLGYSLGGLTARRVLPGGAGRDGRAERRRRRADEAVAAVRALRPQQPASRELGPVGGAHR